MVESIPRRRVAEVGTYLCSDEVGSAQEVAAVTADSLDEKRRGRKRGVMRQGHCA